MIARIALAAIIVLSATAFANPYEDQSQVPKDGPDSFKSSRTPIAKLLSIEALRSEAKEVIRVDVGWEKSSDSFAILRVVREWSGTDALYARAMFPDPHGSYQGTLTSGSRAVAYDSLGTGKEFRRLSRGLTFRFPYSSDSFMFALKAENPLTGEMEEVLSERIDGSKLASVEHFDRKSMEVRRLKEASASPYAVLNVYAEGYRASAKSTFWQHAQKVVTAFENQRLPNLNHLQINAVFAPSTEALGSAEDLGDEAVDRDSFLGLYFPHWNKFGRWYHVVYPTDFQKYRNGLGSVPYDYAVTLIDSGDYWGVGNFKELTAIPARSANFTFLLMHELGHYFGLNEEYTGGGPTELEFAPNIEEPWSQNITFQTDRDRIKWNRFIQATTPVPTAASVWRSDTFGPWGAYAGGYADSEPRNTARKPGLACTMDRGNRFCPICEAAIGERIAHDTGMTSL